MAKNCYLAYDVNMREILVLNGQRPRLTSRQVRHRDARTLANWRAEQLEAAAVCVFLNYPLEYSNWINAFRQRLEQWLS